MKDSPRDERSARDSRSCSDPDELPSAPAGVAEGAKVTRLEMILSGVLRVGVLLSLTITLVGLVLLFLVDPPNAVVRQTGPFVFHDPYTILGDALRLRPKAIIDAGLILLILTPIARVGVTVVAFIVDRDVIYTVTTLFVLAVLIASFFLGHVG